MSKVVRLNRIGSSLSEDEWRWHSLWHVVNKRFNNGRVRLIPKEDLVSMILEIENLTKKLAKKAIDEDENE